MPGSIVRSSVIGYALLLASAVLLAWWQGRLGELFAPPSWPATGINVLIGAALAAMVLSAGAAFRATFEWARRLENEFRLALGGIDVWGALALAVSSGIAEEAFFRGVMQPVFGLVVTSVAFGLLHYPVNSRLIPWTVMAVVMGFVFGIVYQETGSLVAVAVGHALINFVELASLAGGSPDSSSVD